MKADECLIYTDVDGVYTTDPRIVPEARRLHTVSFEEMLEMASMGSKVLPINDVARSFFEAPAIRYICVEIPKEYITAEYGRHDKVGHLRMSLHGIRDAAMNWQEEVARELRALGFTRGVYNPCLYFYEAKNLRTFLHGDDFAAVGNPRGN